jgi:ribonuclease HII
MAKRAKIFVGIDEVGRGPLAGPITVAALGVKSDKWRAMNKALMGIKDSKQLSPKQRKIWHIKIMSNPIFFVSCISVSPKIIDTKGISFAARQAVAQCLKKLAVHSSLITHHSKILLDGGLKAPAQFSQETIIKGDEKIPLIAAASIIAKVTRDRHMVRMHKKYPQYGFARHKGYGTRAHFASIKKHGLSKIHRKSFCSRIFVS